MNLSWILPFVVLYSNLIFIVKILVGTLSGAERILAFAFIAVSLANISFVLRFVASSLLESLSDPELAEKLSKRLPLILIIANVLGLILIIMGLMPIGTINLRRSNPAVFTGFGFFSFILNSGFLAYLASIFYLQRCRRKS